jgi:translation initiation factor IF-1
VAVTAIAGNSQSLFDFAGRRSPRAPALPIKVPKMAVDPKKAIETEGKVMAVLAGTMFRVQLSNEHMVLAHISGKMRKRFIRLTTGDRVKLQMSPYDVDKARIVYRL